MPAWRVTISPTPCSSGSTMRISVSSNGTPELSKSISWCVLQRVGAGELGLAVELAQRHAHGQEELERVGPERGAAGRGRLARARSPAGRARAENSSSRPAGARRPRSQRRGADAGPPTRTARRVSGLASMIRGPDVGRDLLPDARRQQQVGRADLAQVAHRRLGTLREAHPDAAQERHHHDVDLLHDPGQRQDARRTRRVRLARVGAQIGRDVLEERPVLQHGELGLRGGARGGAQDGHVLAAARARPRPRTAPARAAAARPRAPAARPSPPAAGRRISACRAVVVIDDAAQLRPGSPSSSSLSTCSSSSAERRRRPRRSRSGSRPRRPARPRRCRASCSPGSAPPARPRPSSAGCGRSGPPPRRAASPRPSGPSAIAAPGRGSRPRCSSCQMPRSFSRIATSLGQLAALCSRSLGKVSSSSSDGSGMAIAAAPRPSADAAAVAPGRDRARQHPASPATEPPARPRRRCSRRP